jgi:hypothetical protein
MVYKNMKARNLCNHFRSSCETKERSLEWNGISYGIATDLISILEALIREQSSKFPSNRCKEKKFFFSLPNLSHASPVQIV